LFAALIERSIDLPLGFIAFILELGQHVYKSNRTSRIQRLF
jgi:hypothetical protein